MRSVTRRVQNQSHRGDVGWGTPKLSNVVIYGYAVDGVGFHCLEVDDAGLVTNPAASENKATVIAAENRLTCELRT
jgi:hypothetical protein